MQNGQNEAKRERGIMKNEMPSPLLDEKICFIIYKVASRYTPKFLAGHYVTQHPPVHHSLETSHGPQLSKPSYSPLDPLPR
jgi:hypothetical protein